MSSDGQQTASTTGNAGTGDIGGRYAWYAMMVLMIVYVFNFIDRQILSILAEEIKADLGISDAEIGFLYGTVFAVFYAVFGIPLARLADLWTRKSLISIGLFFWSAMTALSGTARNFTALAAFRIGVGVGESSASPAAFSMLGDYFAPQFRASAVAIYSSGVYIGSGIGLFLGGWILDGWNGQYPDPSAAPFGIKAWQAAFFAVGIPGLFMALWVRTLREPVRGRSEGIKTPATHPHPFHELGRELASVIPPFTLWSLSRSGAGTRGLALNLAGAGVIALVAWGLIAALGSEAQWIALSVGVYCAFSWIHGLSLRDRPAFAMIYQSKAIVFGITGFACIAFVGYGVGFWFSPYLIRVHGATASEVGMYLGLASAAGGLVGVAGGGILSDWLKRITPRARLYMGFASVISTVPVVFFQLNTESLKAAYATAVVYNIVSSMWIGSAIALVNELVLPRMRATASAYYILMVTFIGLALGPYTMGQISDGFVNAGYDPGEALRNGIMSGMVALVFAVFFLAIACRYVVTEESTRIERAKAAGEEGI